MTIAFIPVRGGSKSIPLKNIKEFCGKPLVYWNIDALHSVSSIDKIIVATDSDKIKDTVNSFGFDKVEIYDRNIENATDTASTESVVLEYISKSNLQSIDTFILVQATSPLTSQNDFENGLRLYDNGKYDSILSCSRTKRFFWNEDGTSINYDYKNRPRRQDFKGTLVENGAFYINQVGNIIRDNNRLSGNIGMYEMPEHTEIEIDEPSDWIAAEQSMRKYDDRINVTIGKDIKLVLTDVDGTLTDSGMYYSSDGVEIKKFNTRDGKAFEILRNNGIKTGIVTTEDTKIVENRASKIKADYVIQGVSGEGKLNAVKNLCSKMKIDLRSVAYIGDDVNCIELLESVGVAACPSDAVSDVKNVHNINVLNTPGGGGVLREFVSMIVK